MTPDLPDFGSWTSQELGKAETAAVEFLNDNINGIADTFDRRLTLLRQVNLMLRDSSTSFDDRMLYLSLIDEIASSLGQSARDFFEIGATPRVARIVKNVSND